jgi:hypothetical protein
VNRGTTHTIRREVTPTAMAYPVAGAEMNSKTIIVGHLYTVHAWRGHTETASFSQARGDEQQATIIVGHLCTAYVREVTRGHGPHR